MLRKLLEATLDGLPAGADVENARVEHVEEVRAHLRPCHLRFPSSGVARATPGAELRARSPRTCRGRRRYRCIRSFRGTACLEPSAAQASAWPSLAAPVRARAASPSAPPPHRGWAARAAHLPERRSPYSAGRS